MVTNNGNELTNNYPIYLDAKPSSDEATINVTLKDRLSYILPTRECKRLRYRSDAPLQVKLLPRKHHKFCSFSIAGTKAGSHKLRLFFNSLDGDLENFIQLQVVIRHARLDKINSFIKSLNKFSDHIDYVLYVTDRFWLIFIFAKFYLSKF